MNNAYATAEETASVMRQATPNELWLQQQLDRIAPHRHEQGGGGDAPALERLVFELRANLTSLSKCKATDPAATKTWAPSQQGRWMTVNVPGDLWTAIVNETKSTADQSGEEAT